MRQLLIDYIKGLNLRSFKLSEELPFSQSGIVLYTKNPKRIYVDRPQTSVEPFLQVLNADDVYATIDTIRVYFATDSKQQINDYDSSVTSLVQFKDSPEVAHYFQRSATVETEYENDLTVTTVEFNFSKLT